MESSNIKKTQSNQLLFAGMLLFFLGLIVGLAAPVFANPRMAVSSHMEGILNGIFLIVLGLIWDRILVTDRWLKITYWLVLYGTFVNWFAIMVAAIFNAGKMLGIVANGKEGSPLPEAIVSFCLITLTLAMLISCIIILTGLWRNRK